MSTKIRVAGALVGDIQRQPDMGIKYGLLFDAVSRRFDLLDVYDASLHGVQRYWNAAQTFQPSILRWKARFFKNVSGFRMRSSQARKHFQGTRAEVILQLGALFDLGGEPGSPPVVLYTDNTSRISARRPGLNRHPFTPAEFEDWLVYENAVYAHVAHICTRSHLVRRSLMEEYAVPDEKITVAGGGLNFAGLPAPTQPGSGRRFTVLFIGSDFLRKGGDLALKAFALLRRLHPEARMLIVTGDTIPAGLPHEGVTFHAPIWQRDRMEALYRQADIFVLPSRLETWGDVLLEAMSFGIPCIGVKGQAMEDIIRNGETGLLVEPDQVESLAAAMNQLLETPDLRRSMGEAARKSVEQDHTWEAVVARLAPILECAARKASVSSRNSTLERMSV